MFTFWITIIMLGALPALADWRPSNAAIRVSKCPDNPSAPGSSMSGNIEMQSAADVIARRCKNIIVSSCFRSQGRQDELYANCRAKHDDCSGRVAKVSYHTKQTAMDFLCTESRDTMLGCQAAQEARAEWHNGHGGIGGYGDGSNHFDNGPMRGWNKCAGMPSVPKTSDPGSSFKGTNTHGPAPTIDLYSEPELDKLFGNLISADGKPEAPSKGIEAMLPYAGPALALAAMAQQQQQNSQKEKPPSQNQGSTQSDQTGAESNKSNISDSRPQDSNVGNSSQLNSIGPIPVRPPANSGGQP